MTLALDLANLAVLAAGAAAALGLMKVAVRNWPPLGLMLISVVAVLAFQVPIWPSIISISGVPLSFPDVILVILALDATRERSISQVRWRYTFIVLGTVTTFSLGVGAFLLNFGAAMNEARSWLTLGIMALWVATQLARHPRFSTTFEVWLLWTGGLISVVALVNIGIYGLGSSSSGLRSADGEILQTGRPIASGQAMFVALAAFVALHRLRTERSARYGLLAVAYLVIVIVVQHRSVWAAAAAGLLVVAVAWAGGKRVVIAAITLLLAGATYLVGSIFSLGSLGQLLATSVTDTGTYQGRVWDWQVLIGNTFTAGWDAVLLGFPFGTGWVRARQDGMIVDYVPHNVYVTTYLRLGSIGLALFLSVLVRAAIRLTSTRATNAFLPILIALCVYGWAYNLPIYLAAALAMAVFVGVPPREPAVPAESSRQSPSPVTNRKRGNHVAG